jgi:SOS response regulatory protein OraA/RecX
MIKKYLSSEVTTNQENIDLKNLTFDRNLYPITLPKIPVYPTNKNKITSAIQMGRQAARCGSFCPDLNKLILKKGYTTEEALAYIEAFKEASGSEHDQLIRRARRAGGQAARLGFNLPSYNQLKHKKYNHEQILAFTNAYHKASGSAEEQNIRRIRLAGYQAAKYGCKRPSQEKLLKKGYTESQIQIYYQAYDKTAGTHDEQIRRKVKRDAYQLARLKSTRPDIQYLLNKGYDDDMIEFFYKIFDQTIASLFN